MATHLGVAAALGPQDLDEGLLARAQVVYLEGYLWDQPPAKKALRRAMEVAHEADALVALTLSDPFCVSRHRREFLDLLHGEIDVLFANEEEVTMLFDASTFEDAVAAVEETGLLAAVTRGAAGSVVVSASGPVAVPAEPVDRRGGHHRGRRPVRGRVPVRADPRVRPGGLRPAGRAVRGGGHLPPGGPAPGRPPAPGQGGRACPDGPPEQSAADPVVGRGRVGGQVGAAAGRPGGPGPRPPSGPADRPGAARWRVLEGRLVQADGALVGGLDGETGTG